jgi:hypothetical protein
MSRRAPMTSGLIINTWKPFLLGIIYLVELLSLTYMKF